jgi:tetratricopeptide (TPR) repeat protein
MEELSNLLEQASLAYELEDYQGALVILEQVTVNHPRYAVAWFNRGNSLRRLRQYKEAIQSYDKALEIRPSYAEAWLGKGNSLHGLERYEQAIQSYDKALEINQNVAEAWINRSGAALVSSGYISFPFLEIKGLKAQQHYLLNERGFQGQIATLSVGLTFFEEDNGEEIRAKLEGWVRLKRVMGKAHFDASLSTFSRVWHISWLSLSYTGHLSNARKCYEEVLEKLGDEPTEPKLEVLLDLIKVLLSFMATRGNYTDSSMGV